MDDVTHYCQHENAAQVVTQLSRGIPATSRTQQLAPGRLSPGDEVPAPVRHFVDALWQYSPPDAHAGTSTTSHIEALVTQLCKAFYQHAWLELGHRLHPKQPADDASDHLSADLTDRLMNGLADHLVVHRSFVSGRPPTLLCRLGSTSLAQELLTDMLYVDQGGWELASDPVPNGMSDDEASRHHAHAFCLRQYNQFLQNQSFPLKGPVLRRFGAGPLSSGELTCDAGLLPPHIDTLINGALTTRIRSSNVPARSSPCSTQSEEASATPGTQERYLQNEVAMKILNWALAHEITVLPQVDGAFIVPASAATAAAQALDKAWELTLGEAQALAGEASSHNPHHSLPIAV